MKKYDKLVQRDNISFEIIFFLFLKIAKILNYIISIV